MKNDKDLLIKVKQQFPLTIKRLGINGEGVGYFKKKVVFVPGALPGEEVVVEVTKAHPKFAEAIVKKVRKRSEHRVKAPCIVYEQCGGCQLQHLEYSQQLKEKRDILIQALERHTRFNIEEMDIRPTIGMDNPWHYRNKSQFQLGEDHGKVIAGMYSIDSHRLINIPECIVQQPVTNKVTNIVKQILADFRVPIYNEKTRKGIVRTIVTRVGVQTGQVQVMLVTARKELPRKEAILSEIKKRLPEVVSVMQNVNPKRTSIILGDETIHLAGDKIVEERLEEFTYELSARAFFQLNPAQTVILYNEVKEAAALTGNEKIVDAYCGVGTIGLWLADKAGEIRGMDVIPEGIEDAKKNARKHERKNASYFTGKAEDLMLKWVKEGWRPDVVVVDPPRTGCDEKFLDTILKVKPKKFIYVSCNPSTLAKDLQMLGKKYEVEYLQPVDMFPQTAHVEVVGKLVLKN
ncbi:23S rRNA (uracil(1939)-C(5))-methyltransferase RlmD [Heyndrickxia oleronia]|uniref:23S rRNA (Uracil(1939)-C(5))-methyltransferase RlmD n=1 Tax=Heyndrickxia oleronia TaxID=38875 RepID=A0A8E2LGL9_9BACI|nr:23S rRNA (uracil(1939)-C(5))-methyltransferase RlmD [Heyndrickxia oleronia]MEC1373500.1 23S rRNA (uracil(1939)-C(5))-methyltransferase RlmD [Heyndrickxia oleronia]OJH16162.1 23S rRNA (uracil-5-)-methyltransferase RumA [Bacillus obstructivus]OOP69289.1 23S rRNA (uracil(1939)-C(5))-methyltransferase RlmD [Heyndrickxia oleronia]QQZ04212.1 23S rRNA (uracil(1939)-C(5))-methyltransferase RlmD [Heyndrickxia oleronia]